MKFFAGSACAFTIVTTCIFFTAQAQTAKSKALQKQDAAIVKNLKQHIGVLADDSLEGRRAGTPGEMKAVNYLVSYYKSLGLNPVAGKDYITAFTIDEGKVLAPGSRVQINDVELKNGADFFPLAWSTPGKIQDVSSVALQEQGSPWWIDLKEAMEGNTNNPHFLPEQYLKEQVREAAKKGATAIFVYNTSTKADSLAFVQKDKSQAEKIPVIYVSAAAMKKLGIDATSSPSVTADIAFAPKTRIAHNVVTYIDNGALTTVILGAHLDHLGYGEDHNSRYTADKPEIHNGADDNASGTAALMELARIIKDKNSNNKKKNLPVYAALHKNNYLFIHFSGEELGLYGSKFFVDSPSINLSNVNYMINMDMVGRLNDSSALTIGGVGTSPIWGNVLTTNNDGFKIKIDSSGTGPSDHTSFYRKDIPVLFFFTGLHHDYHTPTDDAEKINYEGEARIIDYIEEIVINTADKGKLAFTKTKEQAVSGSRYKVSVGIMPDYTFSGNGVRADGVIEGRPAQKAGLVTGDVIVKLGEFPVSGMDSYMQALNKFEKGQTTTVTIKRGNDEKTFPITF